MGKNTSILLGDYFESFVNEQVRTGKYTSVGEIVRTALRLLEMEENKSKILINEIKIGEKSGMIENFDRNSNLKKFHAQHLKK